jgi:hypothetical protein
MINKIICVLVSFFLISFNAIAQNKLNDLVENSCFKIECYKDGQAVKTGSGFILNGLKKTGNSTHDYVAVTNEHVIENTDSIIIIFNDGSRIKSSGFIYSSHRIDASLIKISSFRSLSPVFERSSFDSLKKINIGDQVYSISSPKGLINTVSTGIISALRQSESSRLIQYTAPVSHGSSGGLLINSSYKPIGIIVSQYSEGQNLNFAIPLTVFLENLIVENVYDKNLNIIDSKNIPFPDLYSFIEERDIILKEIISLINDEARLKTKLYTTKNEYLTERLLDMKAKLYAYDDDINNLLSLIHFTNKKYNSLISNSTLLYTLMSIDQREKSRKNINLNKIDLLKELDDELLYYLTFYLKGIYYQQQENEAESMYNFKIYSDYFIKNYKSFCEIRSGSYFSQCVIRKQILGTTCISAFRYLGAFYISSGKNLQDQKLGINYLKYGIDILNVFGIKDNIFEMEKLVNLLIVGYIKIGYEGSACDTYKLYSQYVKDQRIRDLLKSSSLCNF